ncbi:recombinase family protein [Nocardia sp. NPDC055165]
MRIAIYLRQSLDSRDDRLAIARQRKECLALCANRGWTDIVEYVDNDVSATVGKRRGPDKGTRPAYDRMVRDIESGKIQGVVALDLDRLYRKPVELEHLIDLAERDGLVLNTCGGDADLSTDSGRLFARIKAAVAKAEMERKSARQKLQHQQRAEAGKPWGATRSFGRNADYTLHPVEAPLAVAAYDDLLAGIKSSAIARAWRAAGVKTTVGGEWNGTRVSAYLSHPRNAGHLVHLGEIVKRDAFPALVSEDVWLAAHEILSDPARDKRGPDRSRKYLLSGIARCGPCKSPVYGSHSQYSCRADGCMKVSRKRVAVDDLIDGLVIGRLSQPDAVELLVDREQVDLDALRREAKSASTKLTELASAFVADEITREQLRTGTEKAKARLAKAESAMADSARVQLFEGLIGPDVDVLAAWTKLRESEGGLSRCRAVISALMLIEIEPTRQGVRFQPESIRVTPREP